MSTIEIRQNKRKLIPMLFLLITTQGVVAYFIYFSGKFDNNDILKLLYIPVIAWLVYSVYLPARKFFRNEPVLTLSSSGIDINDKRKPLSLLWIQVLDWKIKKDKDDTTYYLFIETADRKKKINISWLEKKPAEIEELLKTYRP